MALVIDRVWVDINPPDNRYMLWFDISPGNRDLKIFYRGEWVNALTVISDIELIREGAARGMTAYQKPEYGIPLRDLDIGVQKSIYLGETAYRKPEGGIPFKDINITKADLDLDKVTNDTQVRQSEKGVAGGVATLNQNGKVFNTLLPNIPLNTSDLNNDSHFITSATDKLVHYYLASETYSKEEIDEIINSVSNFEYIIIEDPNELPDASLDTMGKFYIYDGDRYITTKNGNVYSWVNLGSYNIDLSEYVTTQNLENELENRPKYVKLTEEQMESMISDQTWTSGILYYTVEGE